MFKVIFLIAQLTATVNVPPVYTITGQNWQTKYGRTEDGQQVTILVSGMVIIGTDTYFSAPKK